MRLRIAPCKIASGKPSAQGYARVTRNGITRLAHRVACEEAHGPPPSSQHQACHRCGVRMCIEPEHLYWGTQSQNEADRLAHGTDNNGERNGQCKLSAEQVAFIRALPKASRRVAREMNESWSQFLRIRSGQRRALA